MEPRKPRPSSTAPPATATAASEITGGGPSPTRAVTTALSGSPPSPRQAPSSSLAAVAVTACLLVAGLGGGALLAWWAVAFRHANAMLWMVPAGLVLLGTPLVAWLSVVASGTAPQPPPPTAVDLGAALHK